MRQDRRNSKHTSGMHCIVLEFRPVIHDHLYAALVQLAPASIHHVALESRQDNTAHTPSEVSLPDLPGTCIIQVKLRIKCERLNQTVSGRA